MANTKTNSYTTPDSIKKIKDRVKKEGYHFADVDEEYVNQYLADAQSFITGAEDNYKGIEWSNASSRHDVQHKTYSDLSKRGDTIRAWLHTSKDKLDEETYNSLSKALSDYSQGTFDIMEGYRHYKDYYTQYETEEDYKKALKAQEEHEALMSYDLEKGKSEIDELRKIQDEYAMISDLSEIAEIEKKYGISLTEVEAQISEKKQYYTLAKRAQKAVELASVADLNSANYDAEFFRQSGVNNAYAEGDVTYKYINDIDNYREEQKDLFNNFTNTSLPGYMPAPKVKPSYIENNYDQMKDEEIAIYNYYYNTEGKEKAEEYLDSLQETLNYRKGQKLYYKYNDNLFKQYVFGAYAGLDQFGSGIANLFSNEDYIAPSDSQIASGMIREDLADDGFKLPEWAGGASIGQVGYDAVNTIANMLPSILVSNIPYVGQVAGATLLGASAAGNAKAEMLQLGYSKEQATTYGLLVGASEGVLQYAIGGISKLGGKVTNNTISKFLSKIDNGFARTAIKIGGNMASEGLEESLQSIIEPVLKSCATGEDLEAIDWGEVVYSGLLGMVTAGLLEGPSTIAGEVNTYKEGKALKGDTAALDRLTKLGSTMSADSVAYRLAGKVDANTGAYTIGRLLNEVGASLSEANTADIVKSLERKGVRTEDAQTIAKWLGKVVEGKTFSKRQVAILESNDVVAQTLVDVLINPNSTVWQRESTYNELKELANTKVSKDKASPTQAKATPVTENPTAEENATEEKIAVSESGKTTYNGNEVEIKDIASIENGRVKLMLESGEEADISEVEFANEEEGLVYEAVASMELDTARDMVQAFKAMRNAPLATPQTAQDFITGFNEAYTYGRLGIPEESLIRDGKYHRSLFDGQKKIAYNRGKIDAETSVKSRQSKLDEAVANAKPSKSKANGKVTYDKGIRGTLPDGDIRSESLKLLEFFNTHFSHAKVRIYASYVDKTGRRVYRDTDGVVKSAPNGMYLPDGSIAIDLNAGEMGQGQILYTYSHELTHMAKRLSPEKYKAYADFLFKHYGKNHSVEELVKYEIDSAANKGRKLSTEKAYDEAVARLSERMLVDVLNGTAQEKLTELNTKHKDIFEKIKEFFAKLVESIKSLYKDMPADSDVANKVHEMQDVAEQLQAMWLDMVVDAGNVNNTLGGDVASSLMLAEESTDAVSVEDATAYSYRSLAEAAGFEAIEENGRRAFIRDGKAVSKVTVEDIENSPIGAFINYSLEMKDITEADAIKQKKLFADICTLACKTNDFAMSMQFVGSAVFTAMKANADKQYGTTYDFPSICTKTQAVIDAMSARMVKLGRGLSTKEIEAIYQEVFTSGNPVPCPECYVFSRWIGIGGLLDNIKKYQEYYGKMSVTEVAEAYKKMRSEVEASAIEMKLSFGKAKGALTKKYTTEYNKLTEKIEKQENQGEKVNEADRKKLAELEKMMNTVKAMTWIENVYFADSAFTKVNKNFRVPDDVLFDLNKGEVFASQYKEAWAFRTTQGAGYGKAITPYAEAVLGEGILVTNNTSNAIKGKAQGTLNNYFLKQRGKMDATARKALDKARAKQKNQAFIGSQRFQSTSDARYENASDYLLAALEMQAMHGGVQVYTKVDGAVPAFEAWGFSTNQSLMPKGSGLDENGNVVDTSVGGMSPKVATENRNKYEHAGTITIGVNDNHIRALYRLVDRDFIIPYHASGGKADLIAEFRRIQEGQEKRGVMVRSTDYSRTQSDKVLSDDVLKWLGKTDAEIEQIHKVREARVAILTGGKVDMDVVRGNRFLSALYDKLHGGEWDGVKLAKGKIESQIFPNEFWDTTVSYEESGKITRDYLEYCDDLGFLHRFSGLVPSNGKLVSVKGYDEKGNRVTLTDLAYVYDENGQKTDTVEDFYWNNIVDRRMFGHNGQYLPQKFVTLNDTTTDTITSFAKNNFGRQYDKKVSEQTAKKVADALYSDRDNIVINENGPYSTIASDFVAHMNDIVSRTKGWYAKDVFKYVEAHPEIGFIELIKAKDKDAKKNLEKALDQVDDVKVLEKLSWFMCQAYGDKDRTWSWDEGATYPYRGATRTFQNAVKKRINALMTEKVGGTNLGIKNGQVSLQDVKALFDKLNGIEEFAPLAEKVFATAEKLGVNIRFVNQTLSKKPVSGDAMGDMVEYKTSYFNDTSVADQRKASTILHELIHICTVYVMKEDSKYNYMGDYAGISNKSADYVKLRNVGTRLNRIFNEIQKDPDFKGQYGLTNSMEMVAELANEKFVGLLKKKSLWERIVEAIAELFGFSKGNTAYDNALQCLDYMLDNPDVAEYKAHAKEQRENARYNGMSVFGSTKYTDYYGNDRTMYSDRDSDYLDAVNRGDMKTAQKMLDEAASEAGYIKLFYHGTPNGDFTKFNTHGKPIWITASKEYAEKYSKDENPKSYKEDERVMPLYAKMENRLDITSVSTIQYAFDDYNHRDPSSELKRLADVVGVDVSVLAKIGRRNNATYLYHVINTADFAKAIREKGYDSIKQSEYGNITFGVLDSSQLKSANVATYNKKKVIPLSKRFDSNNDNILYSDRILMGSLFSGGGTLEAGLAYQMLDKQFGVEYEDKIAAVYAANHGDHIQVGKVEDFDISKYDDIFYLHASPVCHNFSSAKHGAKESQVDIDSAKATAKHLETAMPPVFTVENAPRYRKSQSLKIITDKLTELGYKWDVDVYNSADYGSATSRNRVILRAVKDGELPEKPTKQDRTNSWDKVTRDLWETLPKASIHSWFVPAIKNTKNLPIMDGNGKLNVNKPLLLLTTTSSKTMTFCWEGEICPTLTTKCGEAQLVMPDGNVYNVTPEFMGRIQGLPDDYKYPKAKSTAFTIIGNGIPTHLTKAVIGGLLDSAYEQTHDGQVLYSERATNAELAEMDDTALYIKNTKNANYIGMIFNGTKTEETRSTRTLDAFIGKDFYVTDGKYVYGSIVMGEPHKYTEAEFHKTENQRKHRVPKGDEYDVKPGGIKWAYPIESYNKFDKPKKLSDSKEYKNSYQARQVLYSDRDAEAREFSDADIMYSLREEDPPKKTIIGYKVFFVKNGKLYPPMVANPNGEGTPVGVWLDADDGQLAYNKDGTVKTNSFGRPRVKAGGKGTQGGSGDLAYRPGWHLGDLPMAKQFARADADGNKTLFPAQFVWAECDVAADVEYQEEADAMGYKFSKNGKFNHQQASLDHMPREEDGTAGYYRYRTNPDPTTEAWIITGAMKVNRLLTDEEVNSILKKNGKTPMPRQGGELDLAKLGLTESDFNALYSERDPDSFSNRTLLANALESVAVEAEEKNLLRNYKTNIRLIEAEEQKLAEIQNKLFTKGAVEPAERKELQTEMKLIRSRINTYDRELFRLETMSPLKKVLQREKDMARKRAEQKGREALARQREIDAEKTRILLNRASESRKKGIERRSKTELRRKIRKLIKDLNHILKNGTKERNVKEDMKETVASAITLAEVLFNDDIKNEDIVRLGVDSVTEEEGKLLTEYKAILDSMDTIDAQIEGLAKGATSKSEVDNLIGDLEVAKAKLKNKLGTLNKKLADVFVRERARLNKAKVSVVMDSLVTNYSALKDSGDAYIKNAYSEAMETRLKTLKTDLGGTLVRDMSIEQLQAVYDAFKMVQHMIRTSNSLFREGRMEDLMTIVSAVQEEIFSLYKDRKDPINAIESKKNIIDTFAWNNLKPVYAFDRLGSATFQKLFWDAVKADDDFARLTTEAGKFLQEQRAAHGYADWDLTKATEFKLADGKVFKLTLEDMMSIYAYSKREQASEHMTDGGFVFDENNTYTEKPFDGKKFIENFRIKKKHAKLTETYRVDLRLIAKVMNSLSAEQKAYVDAMQKYMTDMGEKGNEVSRTLYGIDLFTEEHYIPLQSSKEYLNSNKQALDNTQTQVSLKNNGTTKATIPGANNPIVLRAFDELWLEHIDTMSKYCAYVLPIENLTRVFNNVSRIEGESPMSTQALIGAVFGNGAKAYFDQYITDLNGGNKAGGYQSPLMTMFSRFKGTAVGASLSVVVQQPFAVIRAMDMVRPDYFIPFLRGQHRAKDSDPTWEEIKKYAPIAILKEMGGFDIGSAGSTKDYIGITEYQGVKGKLKGLAKDSKYRKKAFDDALMFGATKADELGWGIIWKAVKKEVATEQKLTPGTEEFFKAVGERFTEVVVRTQVYDSVNSRSGIMRSKNDLNKFATSFAGEPTTVINMFFNAGLKVTRAIKSKEGRAKAIGQAARTSGVVLASIVLTSLAKSAIYANRDDDDDESWVERWMKNFGDSLSSDLNPLTMIPYLRDLVSIYEGWDIERPDMTLFASIITSAKRCLDEGATEEEILTLSGDIANLFGIPAKNIVREVKGIINLINDHFDNIHTTDAWGAFERGFTGEEQSKTDALYQAIINGDSGKVEHYKSTYKTDSAYESARRTALTENDPRIQEAVMANIEGDVKKRVSIVLEIKGEGNFTQDEIVVAVNNATTNFNTKVKAALTAKANGKTEEHDKIVKELLEKYPKDFVEKMLGETILEEEPETEDKEIGLYEIEDYYTAILNGDKVTANTAYKELLNEKLEEGYLQSEAEDAIATSFSNEVKKAYMAGEIKRSKAISLLADYTEKGESEVKKWDFELKHGFSWGERVRKYRLGQLSESELISAVMDIEGDSRETAEEYIRFLDLEKGNPTLDITAADAEQYFKYAESAGISVDVYLDYKARTKGLTSDKDANGKTISGSKKKKVMAVIHSLPLTSAQKDALYYANGWAKSELHEAPWH